jgi:hypothetical protein
VNTTDVPSVLTIVASVPTGRSFIEVTVTLALAVAALNAVGPPLSGLT